MTRAEQYLRESHEDGRTYGGEYKLRLVSESGETARVYFSKMHEAQAAYEHLQELQVAGESITLEKRRNLSRPFEWDVIDSA